MKKEINILGSIAALYVAAIAGVWIHHHLLDTPPFHKLLPLTLIILTLAGVKLTFLRNISIRKVIVDFFNEKSHPLNLAVVRIVLFGYLFTFSSLEEIMAFGRLPGELIIPPTGMEFLLSFIPINDSSMIVTHFAFRFFCLTAAAGLFTRFSALMVRAPGDLCPRYSSILWQSESLQSSYLV